MHTLKSLRSLKNMTQEEAAKTIGVSVDTWRNWERHKSYPSVPQIQKIERSFNVSYNDIIFLPKVTV